MRFFPIAATLILLLALQGCTAKARVDLSGIEDTSQEATPRPQEGLQRTRAFDASGRSSDSIDGYANSDRGQHGPRGTLGWSAESQAAGQGQHVVLVVREGDTLYSIAKQHDVPVAALFSANGLVTDKLVPGQQLVVPVKP